MAAYDYIQDVIAAGLEYFMPVEVRDLTKAQLKNMSENHKDKPTSDAAYAQLDIVLGLCEPGFADKMKGMAVDAIEEQQSAAEARKAADAHANEAIFHSGFLDNPNHTIQLNNGTLIGVDGFEKNAAVCLEIVYFTHGHTDHLKAGYQVGLVTAMKEDKVIVVMPMGLLLLLREENVAALLGVPDIPIDKIIGLEYNTEYDLGHITKKESLQGGTAMILRARHCQCDSVLAILDQTVSKEGTSRPTVHCHTGDLCAEDSVINELERCIHGWKASVPDLYLGAANVAIDVTNAGRIERATRDEEMAIVCDRVEQAIRSIRYSRITF